MGALAPGVDNPNLFAPPVAAVQQSDEKLRNAFSGCYRRLSFT
jgi:hypothetical protein